MRNVAAFLLGVVWFIIFGIYAIVTLPALVLFVAMMIGASIRGDWDDDDKWSGRVDMLFMPMTWLAQLGLGWIRKDEV